MRKPVDHQLAVMSARIRQRREALGLTQAEVAALAGMKQANYSRMESGRQTPNLETLLLILSALRMEFCLVPSDDT